eukprot:166123-Chlamydomonas_euryale.AAC.1
MQERQGARRGWAYRQGWEESWLNTRVSCLRHAQRPARITQTHKPNMPHPHFHGSFMPSQARAGRAVSAAAPKGCRRCARPHAPRLLRPREAARTSTQPG